MISYIASPIHNEEPQKQERWRLSRSLTNGCLPRSNPDRPALHLHMFSLLRHTDDTVSASPFVTQGLRATAGPMAVTRPRALVPLAALSAVQYAVTSSGMPMLGVLQVRR